MNSIDISNLEIVAENFGVYIVASNQFQDVGAKLDTQDVVKLRDWLNDWLDQ